MANQERARMQSVGGHAWVRPSKADHCRRSFEPSILSRRSQAWTRVRRNRNILLSWYFIGSFCLYVDFIVALCFSSLVCAICMMAYLHYCFVFLISFGLLSWFFPCSNSSFAGQPVEFPLRRITNEDKDMRATANVQKTHPVPAVKDDRLTKRPRVDAWTYCTSNCLV